MPTFPEREAQDLSGEEGTMVKVGGGGAKRIVDDIAEDDVGNVVEAQQPRGRPDPGTPTPEEYQQHMLTHIPYRRWCRWCAMARARNERHLRLPPFSRTVPPLLH